MPAVDTARLLPELDVLALTLWGEARGESLDGKAAVAWVILNRSRVRDQSITDVCLAKLQFSCWWRVGGASNYAALDRLATGISHRTDALLDECRWVAEGVLKNVVLDRTHGADHYFAASMVPRPKWAATMRQTAAVGAHLFFTSQA